MCSDVQEDRMICLNCVFVMDIIIAEYDNPMKCVALLDCYFHNWKKERDSCNKFIHADTLKQFLQTTTLDFK